MGPFLLIGVSSSSERKEDPREPREISGIVLPLAYIVELLDEPAGDAIRAVREFAGGMISKSIRCM
jgi:hypothetical protein